ncbi:uncharacterized protein LOC142354469 isoform X2 [Convolutriloba macropyga]|uniref:uncharacterized protein LOC142354469 isoform X2 n=1 Tax=Convolutriloba macropyga TaxID=536237 RepID=UPI003F51AE9A
MRSLTEVCDLETISLVAGLRPGKMLRQFSPIIGQLIGFSQFVDCKKLRWFHHEGQLTSEVKLSSIKSACQLSVVVVPMASFQLNAVIKVNLQLISIHWIGGAVCLNMIPESTIADVMFYLSVSYGIPKSNQFFFSRQYGMLQPSLKLSQLIHGGSQTIQSEKFNAELDLFLFVTGLEDSWAANCVGRGKDDVQHHGCTSSDKLMTTFSENEAKRKGQKTNASLAVGGNDKIEELSDAQDDYSEVDSASVVDSCTSLHQEEGLNEEICYAIGRQRNTEDGREVLLSEEGEFTLFIDKLEPHQGWRYEPKQTSKLPIVPQPLVLTSERPTDDKDIAFGLSVIRKAADDLGLNDPPPTEGNPDAPSSNSGSFFTPSPETTYRVTDLDNQVESRDSSFLCHSNYEPMTPGIVSGSDTSDVFMPTSTDDKLLFTHSLKAHGTKVSSRQLSLSEEHKFAVNKSATGSKVVSERRNRNTSRKMKLSHTKSSQISLDESDFYSFKANTSSDRSAKERRQIFGEKRTQSLGVNPQSVNIAHGRFSMQEGVLDQIRSKISRMKYQLRVEQWDHESTINSYRRTIDIMEAQVDLIVQNVKGGVGDVVRFGDCALESFKGASSRGNGARNPYCTFDIFDERPSGFDCDYNRRHEATLKRAIGHGYGDHTCKGLSYCKKCLLEECQNVQKLIGELNYRAHFKEVERMARNRTGGLLMKANVQPLNFDLMQLSDPENPMHMHYLFVHVQIPLTEFTDLDSGFKAERNYELERAFYYPNERGENVLELERELSICKSKLDKKLAINLSDHLWIAELEPVVVYYVTTPHQAERVFKRGFDDLMKEWTMLGVGTFFATKLEAAFKLAESKTEMSQKCVVVCKLIPGFFRKSCEVPFYGIYGPFSDEENKEGCSCDFHYIYKKNRSAGCFDTFYCVRKLNSRVLPLYELYFKE